MTQETLRGLSNNPDGWGGDGGGKDVQVAGDMGKLMSDLC